MSASQSLRERLRYLAHAILSPLHEHCQRALISFDLVVDKAEQAKLRDTPKKIKRFLSYITAVFDAIDALLSSGKQCTSIFSQWFVLLLDM